MTSWQKTGAHPFYIGMYIHIYTHIYVHKYTSQKECLHIFSPATLSHWYRNALRQSWAIACVYGAEHYSCWEEAAGFLLRLGEDHGYAWPPHAIFGVWEELWARFIEEMKELDRTLRREMKEEAPSFDRIRFFATSPDFNGDPWLTLPRTFFLKDEGDRRGTSPQ